MCAAAWADTQSMVTMGVVIQQHDFLLNKHYQAKEQRWLPPSPRYWCGMQESVKQLGGDYWLYLLREVHAVNEAALKCVPCCHSPGP
jgi:hypothetical protein